MYKHCNTEEGALRQRQLEQCLLELMADRPLAQITISDICARAGISRKSFYRYFDSKDGCLHALLDHAIMDGTNYYLPEPGSANPDLLFCCRMFEYWKMQSPLLDAMERNGQSLQILQRMVRYVLDEEPHFARYMGISEQDLMEHVVYSVGGIMGLILSWHHEGHPKSPEQMGKLLHQMMSRRISEEDVN